MFKVYLNQITKLHVPLMIVIFAFSVAIPVSAMDISTTKNGIKYRIITKQKTALYAKPDMGSNSSPCEAFKYWYVLPSREINIAETDDPKDLVEKGFYRVASGISSSEERGYIKADDAQIWTHQQAVSFSPRINKNRDLVPFFATAKEAKQSVASGSTDSATHREPEAAGTQLILMPVLDASEITVNKENMQVFQLAAMSVAKDQLPGGSGSGVSSRPRQKGEKVTRDSIMNKSTTDIVFVVDTTSSMRNPIDQVKQSIRKASEKLSNNQAVKERFRFGLVAYRDIVGQPNTLDYVAEVFCDLEQGKDHDFFYEQLGKLEVAKTSSVDYAEDVLAGITVAMDTDRLKWNPLAWKNIIVVGDSSFKQKSHPFVGSRTNKFNTTIAAIKARAQSGATDVESFKNSHYVLHAIYVQDPLAKSDHAPAETHYGDTVAGRQYVGEFIIAKGGDTPEDFSERLYEDILKKAESFRSTMNIGGPTVGPSSGASVPDSQKALPLIVMLNAAQDESKTGGLGFTSRFASEFDNNGNRLLEPHLWVRKGDLMGFSKILDFLVGQLEDAGEPGSKNVSKVVKSLQNIVMSLNMNEPITADMPIDKFLALLGGFPLKSDIFKFSISQLAAMNQTDYADWVNRIKETVETLQELQENQQLWKRMHELAKERDFYAFIRLSDLP